MTQSPVQQLKILGALLWLNCPDRSMRQRDGCSKELLLNNFKVSARIRWNMCWYIATYVLLYSIPVESATMCKCKLHMWIVFFYLGKCYLVYRNLEDLQLQQNMSCTNKFARNVYLNKTESQPQPRIKNQNLRFFWSLVYSLHAKA